MRPARRRSERKQLGDTQTETLLDGDDLAACDRTIVNEEIDRVADRAIELDDRSHPEFENLGNGHPASAEFDGKTERHVHEQTDILGRFRTSRLVCHPP